MMLHCSNAPAQQDGGSNYLIRLSVLFDEKSDLTGRLEYEILINLEWIRPTFLGHTVDLYQ